jgi:signal transduction histidine kinase
MADPFRTRRDSKELQILGDMIGSAQHRQLLIAEREEAKGRAERSRVAVHAMGAMVFQSAHRFKNLLQNVVHVKNSFSDARDEGERATAIARLSTLIDTSAKSIERPMDVASRVLGPELILQPLRELLLSECTVHNRQDIEVSVQVPEDLFAWIDRELTREALHNLIDNSVKAMPNGGVLTLSARAAGDGKDAIVEIKDTGVGMTKDEIEAALAGFFSTKGHKGVGVLIASTLITAQGGSLQIQSTKGAGTTVTVQLPLAEDRRAP